MGDRFSGGDRQIADDKTAADAAETRASGECC